MYTSYNVLPRIKMRLSSEYLAAVLGVVITTAILRRYFRNRHFFKLGDRLPGPRAWPIVGNALEFIGNISDVNFIMRKFSPNCEVRRLWFGSRLMVVVNSPEKAQQCYTNWGLMHRSEEFRFMRPLMGTSLVTGEGEEWKRARKTIAPTFQTTHLKNFLGVFKQHGDTLVKELRKQLEKPAFNLIPYLKNCTIDNIWETTMGEDKKFQGGNNKHMMSLKRFSALIFARMLKIWQHSDWVYKFTSESKEHDAIVKSFHSFVGKPVKDQMEKFSNVAYDEYVNSKRSTLINQLLQAGHRSFEELRSHAITMIIAGYDTTSLTMGFVLVMLALHQDVQEKAYQELRQVYENLGNKELSMEDVNQLQYLEMVIKETMRLYPVVPWSDRSVTEDLQLGHHVVPKGAKLIINTYKIHRDPMSYDSPETFNPDNFLPDKIAGRHPYAYIPFGGGPRTCVGSKYAMLSMKVIISTVLYAYKFDCDYKREDLKIRAGIVLYFSKGFNARISERRCQL